MWSSDGRELYYTRCTPVCTTPTVARLEAGRVVARESLPWLGGVDAVLPGDSLVLVGTWSPAQVSLVVNWDVEFSRWIERLREDAGR